MVALLRVCLFFVALLLFSFQNTKRKIQISVGAVAAAITALIFWSIWNSWDSGDRDLKD
jgi:predicted branched-subunit amino acid permease